MRVLIVDDETSVGWTLERVVQGWGAQTKCVHSAPEAVRLMKEQEFDFVLLDFNMPEYSGQWFMDAAKM